MSKSSAPCSSDRTDSPLVLPSTSRKSRIFEATSGSGTDDDTIIRRRLTWSDLSPKIDLKENDPSQSFEASSHRSMPRPSIVSKHFDNSSGSEEDLTLGARRVMRQRKHEQENRKKLGSLVPINGPTSSTGNSQPVEVIRLWEAVLLRAKRAETDYFIGDLKIEATEASVGSYTSQKSSIACPVRQGKSYDVNFGHVEVREFLDSRISGESVISEETAIEETTQKL